MVNNCDKCEELKINNDKIENLKRLMIEDIEAVKLSEVFKALSDPTRIKIIYLLSKNDICVCDIAGVLGMTQSAISHQLRLLRNLRLVRYKKEGKSAIYSLDDEHILNLFNQGMEHINHE